MTRHYCYIMVLILLLIGNGYMPNAEESTVERDSFVYTDLPRKEYMNRWLICGPFPVNASYTAEKLQTDPSYKSPLTIQKIFQLHENKIISSNNALQQVRVFDCDLLAKHGGESEIRPQEGLTHHYNNSEYTWRFYQSDDRLIDWQTIYGNLNFAVAYAYAEIDAEDTQPAHIYLGSDDAAKVWLNGQLVHERWGGRATYPDSDKVPVELQAGKNRLLFKIQNEIGDWSFICRIVNQTVLEEIQKEHAQRRRQRSPFEEALHRNSAVILSTMIAFMVIGFISLVALLRGKF